MRDERIASSGRLAAMTACGRLRLRETSGACAEKRSHRPGNHDEPGEEPDRPQGHFAVVSRLGPLTFGLLWPIKGLGPVPDALAGIYAAFPRHVSFPRIHLPRPAATTSALHGAVTGGGRDARQVGRGNEHPGAGSTPPAGPARVAG